MSDLRKVVEDHWVALEASTSDAEWLTANVPVDAGGAPLRCALDPERRRHLLVPLSRDDVLRPDIRAAAVHLTVRELEERSGRTRYADLALLRDDLADIYTGLCADVLAAVAVEPAGVADTVAHVLDAWHELLRSGAQLGIEALAGLFGELAMLERLLASRPDALGLWTGPLRSAQDFMTRHHSVEVKTTIASEGRSVRVHGLEQLTAPSGGLLLWWRRVDTANSDGVSVPELVSRLEDGVGSAQTLWRLLARAGYYAADRSLYEGVRFTVVEEARYRVTDDFPCLTSASFPAGTPTGVSDVRYTLDLDAAPPPLHESDVMEFLHAMAADA